MKFLTGLLGGTFGYLQAALIVAAGGTALYFWLDYKSAQKDVTRLNSEVTKLENTIQSKDAIIGSQARTSARRAISDEGQANVEDAIQKAPDSSYCNASESINIALDSLRKRYATEAGNSDE